MDVRRNRGRVLAGGQGHPHPAPPRGGSVLRLRLPRRNAYPEQLPALSTGRSLRREPAKRILDATHQPRNPERRPVHLIGVTFSGCPREDDAVRFDDCDGRTHQ